MAQLLQDTTLDIGAIDRSFRLAFDAFDSVGIDARETPIFLALGLPRSQEPLLQRTHSVGNRVRVDDGALPVKWYADETSIWVSLSGISAVSEQAEKLQGRPVSNRPIERPPYMADEAADLGQTFAAPALAPTIAAAEGDRPGDEVFGTLAGSPQQFATLAGGAAYAQSGLASGLNQIRDQEVEAKEPLIDHFAQLLRRYRQPVVPLNGVVFFVPYLGLFSGSFRQLETAARVDMQTLQSGLGTKCLCMTVFSGIEDSSEFREYVQRLDRRQVRRRCGCGFPPLVHLEPRDADRAHTWLRQYFESQIFSLLQRDVRNPNNVRLFRLLDDFRRAKANFTSLLTSAFYRQAEPAFFCGGVYFGAMRSIGNVERPFVDGVVARLTTEHDDTLAWVDGIRDEDARRRNWGRFLIGLAILFFAVAIGFGAAAALLWIQ